MIDKFDDIIESYINGQFKQMKKQMDKVLISEFLENADTLSPYELVKLITIYFKLKER